MEKTLQTDWRPGRLTQISRILLCLLLFDVACTGSGRYISVGWFSPRIVLALFMVLTGLPALIRDFRTQLKNPVNYMILGFWLYLGAEAYVGMQNGNNMAVLKSDLMGFAWLGLIPFMSMLLREELWMKRALSAIVIGASVQAALCVIFNIVFAAIAPQALPDFVEGIWAAGWGTILAVEYNAVRVFCRSCMMIVIACVLLFGAIMRREKFSPGLAALFLLNFFALFYTYTRSIYLALGFALLLSLVYLAFTVSFRKALLRALVLAAAFLLIGFASDLILKQGSFQYAVARGFHRDLNELLPLPLPHTWEQSELDFEDITKDSNDTRDTTTEELRIIIAESPVVGHGLGAVVPSRGGNDEYFYHDMLMRTGVLGLVLYMTPVIYAGIWLILLRKRWKEEPRMGLIYIGLLSFLLASYFNPWMNAVVGISWYGITLTEIDRNTLELR